MNWNFYMFIPTSFSNACGIYISNVSKTCTMCICRHLYNLSSISITFISSCCLFFMSQPHFGASVRMRLTLPKVGTWSPLGLPQLQSSIEEGKTPCLEVFSITLERPWSADVENGLAWTIRTFATQGMVERRARSQTDSLTPDHKKSGIDPTSMCIDKVQHTVGKILRRATSLLQTSSQSKVWAESYELSKSRESKLGQF